MVKVFYFDKNKVNHCLKEYVEMLVKTHPEVLNVVVFGSFVRSESVPGSDVDLLIILSSYEKRFLDRIPDYCPSYFPVGVDIFPYTMEEVERMLKENHKFLKRALKEGIELFARFSSVKEYMNAYNP